MEVDISIENDSCNEYSVLLRLPIEIIECILKSPVLQHADLLNLSEACSKLHDIVRSNELWREKLSQRWPDMLSRYDRGKAFTWIDEFKQRFVIGEKMKTMVADLSPKHYLQEEISREEFNDFSQLMSSNCQIGEFMIDELISILNFPERGKNLTLKFYAEKVLRFVQQTILTEKIKSFTQLPQAEQRIETGATLLAQWCQPTENITTNDISDQLNNIAEEVKQNICTSNPHHPLVNSSLHTTILTEDVWTCEQSKVVLLAINNVLFKKQRFRGNKQNYYDQKNSFIDKVLSRKTGIPITLCIVYASVAGRLGVVCEPVNAPYHFLLRWKEHPLSVGSREQMYTYIDVFNDGKCLSFDQLPAALQVPMSVINIDNMNAMQPIQVLNRMVRNLINIGREQGRLGDNLLCLRNALEFSVLISPDDFELRLLLIRVYLNLDINLLDVINSLQSMVEEDQNRVGMIAYLLTAAETQNLTKASSNAEKKIKVKRRTKPKDALFSVGLVMKHKRYNYDCVIYGWDSKCMATQEWILQMGVNNLPKKDKQPFYNVLVADGSNRYAAQESLELNPDCCMISHPEVGKYFTSFEETHYLPNNEKASEYPDDTDITLNLVREHYHT